MLHLLTTLFLSLPTRAVEAEKVFEEKLVHCEEVVEQNDDFNVWRRSFEACLENEGASEPVSDHRPLLFDLRSVLICRSNALCLITAKIRQKT